MVRPAVAGEPHLFQNNFDDLQQIASNPASDPTGAVGTFVQNAGELDHTGLNWNIFFSPLRA